MHNLLQNGFLYEGTSLPIWQGSQSNKFGLRQRQHFQLHDHFCKDKMVPESSQHFSYKQRKHFSPKIVKQQQIRFRDYYQLYKPKRKDLTLQYPRIERRASFLQRRSRLQVTQTNQKRSQSVKPLSNDNSLGLNKTQSYFSRQKKPNFRVESIPRRRRPYNYDIVDFNELYDDNKKTLEIDSRNCISQLQTFSANRMIK